MVRRKIQRFEVVVIGFNLRAFLDRIAEIAEDANDLVHRLDDGMLGADGTTNAGQGNVETFGGGIKQQLSDVITPSLGTQRAATPRRSVFLGIDVGQSYLDGCILSLGTVRHAGRQAYLLCKLTVLDFNSALLNLRLYILPQLVDALPNIALVCPRRGFQPKIVELGEDAVLARHPTIAKCLPVVLGCDGLGLSIESG